MVSKVKGKGFSKNQISQSGLFTLSDKGVFDLFRSRIMFPIFHPSGKVIAFGGRIFNSDDPAKYLNSPETPLYHKSSVFYGLQATRDSIRKNNSAILVEGYMDFLKLYQGSVSNILATSGAAFTKKHVSSLNRITKRVILLYDGDDAGANAAINADHQPKQPSILRLVQQGQLTIAVILAGLSLCSKVVALNFRHGLCFV